jgi:signal transduction histidine kinase/DNA-binding response OmpR family regulator/streptogramin lyase
MLSCNHLAVCRWLTSIALMTVLILFCNNSAANSPLVDPGPVVEKIEQISGQTLKGIKSLLQDKSGFMWLATSEGLLRFDGHSVKRFVHDAENANSLAHNDIRGIIQDSDDFIWLVTRGGGLSRFTPQTEQFENFAHVPGDITTLDSNQLNAIALSGDQKLWIGSNQGINLFDRKTFKNTRLNASFEPSQANVQENIHQIYQDNQRRVWFSIRRKGLYLHLPDSNKTLHFEHDANDEHSLDANMVSKIYQTRDGNIWIGTAVSINRFNSQTLNFDRFVIPLKDNNKVNHASVTSIFEDHNGGIWIGTFYNGVSLLKPGAGKVVNVNQGANAKDSLNALHINDIYQDSSGTLWFVTPRSGLIKLNPKGLVFDHLLVRANTSLQITGVFADSKGILWLGSNQGQYRFDADLAQFELTEQDRGSVISVVENQQSLTKQMLNAVNLTAKEVNSVVQDHQGALWLGTSKGITRFDPKSGKATAFNQSNGLRLKSVGKAMAVVLLDGDIVMANQIGVVRFSPDKLISGNASRRPDSPVLLSDFTLLGKSVALGSVDPDSPLVTTINKTQSITLSDQQNWFSIFFASNGYQRPEELRYAYKMEGLSDRWIQTNATNRVAVFTSVAPGDYVFKVKVSGPDGKWNDNIRTLAITVTPPWWSSIPAYVLYVVTALFLVFLFNFMRTRQLRLRAAKLEEGIELRTIELQNRADTIAQLLEDKDRLIANISHEFRTPLTLILGPLESQLKSADNEKSRSLLSLAQANGQRLLAMVDQLLDMARLKDQQPVTAQPKNVLQTCHFLIESFRSMAQKRNIDLSLANNNQVDCYVQMQPDALEKILSNLLTNAFKYAGDDQKITLETIIDNSNQVLISVQDTGQGISEADQLQIFNRFTRLKNSGAYVPGAGIGLALVKDLVEQHEGTIAVQSELGKGSKFIVTLPLFDLSNLLEPEEIQVNEAYVLSAVEQVQVSERPVLLPVDESLEALNDQKVNILVIEDNYDMRQYIVSCLDEKYHCTQAGDGEEGIEVARQTLPDLIISDVMMPKVDGFEVTQTLKNDNTTSHIPIVLLTARGDSQSRIKGWSEMADEFLEKPFNITELLIRIENLLAVRRLLRQRYQGEFAKVVVDNTPQDEIVIPQQSEVEEPPINAAHQAFFDQINALLEESYTNEKFDVAQFAVEMALSHRQLGRKMKSLLDMTPAEAIRNFRLKKAAELLSKGVSPSVVAHKVGFSTHSYFSQCFKTVYGCNPSGYSKAY